MWTISVPSIDIPAVLFSQQGPHDSGEYPPWFVPMTCSDNELPDIDATVYSILFKQAQLFPNRE